MVVHRQRGWRVPSDLQNAEAFHRLVRCATPLVLDMEDLEFGTDLLFYIDMDPPGRITAIVE